MGLEGGARFIKYLLIIFNFLFLLSGLALIIVGAVAAAKLTPYSVVQGVHFNGVGIFIIIIGIVIFIVSFFGCLGAYKENYCLLIVFIILLVITFLALIAALIAAFAMKNSVKGLIKEAVDSFIMDYGNSSKPLVNQTMDVLQKEFECCGSYNYTDWQNNKQVQANQTHSVPDSCCMKDKQKEGCGKGQLTLHSDIYLEGCSTKVGDFFFRNLIAVGGVAAAIAILQFLGIVLAGCLAHSLRKEYNTV